MIVVDQAAAYLGSINYLNNSLEHARETGIFFSQADAISLMTSTFETDWSNAVDVPSSLPTNCPRF
jgi:hypothetical protein